MFANLFHRNSFSCKLKSSCGLKEPISVMNPINPEQPGPVVMYHIQAKKERKRTIM